jgi:hypothetical protein
MGSLGKGILLFSLAVAPSFADTIFFQGTLAADDQVALFNITFDTSEIVTIETDSYAGGTLDSIDVPAGGFAPAAFLFDNIGGVLTLVAGGPGQVGLDPTTGSRADIFYQDPLGPGTYTLALAVLDNSPAGLLPADGFAQDGNPGFTCASEGVGGSFCDLTDAFFSSRTGNYAIAITGADSVIGPVPEPGSILLLLAGGAFIALRRRSLTSR